MYGYLAGCATAFGVASVVDVYGSGLAPTRLASPFPVKRGCFLSRWTMGFSSRTPTVLTTSQDCAGSCTDNIGSQYQPL